MMDTHTAVAIAQIVFYVPIVPLVSYILFRNWHNRPRQAWITLVPVSLIRLIGGIITVVLEEVKFDLGLAIADIILLNVGMIPLIVTVVGLLRIVLATSPDANKVGVILIKLIRIAFVAAVALLVAGGSLTSNENIASIGRALQQAGYVVFTAVLALCAGYLGYLTTQKHRLDPEVLIYINLTLVAIPTLVIRAVYGLLFSFTSSTNDSKWNPLYGSPIAFALMCLLTEYISIVIFIYLGLHRIRQCRRSAYGRNTDAEAVEADKPPRT